MKSFLCAGSHQPPPLTSRRLPITSITFVTLCSNTSYLLIHLALASTPKLGFIMIKVLYLFTPGCMVLSGVLGWEKNSGELRDLVDQSMSQLLDKLFFPANARI
ncbi:hypothetical protein Moror_13548 [Moniliophthora roreri MCA 2997]|uniref:Uncharacterized protein n=1 Tax=Moniliophthora roreri (strain MCA 2997) TaxID=1381753 RepID=V2WAG8_MONRO|nr:hypothetical protein Moror_13548 [Moniliophthora roreri MCA 2997]